MKDSRDKMKRPVLKLPLSKYELIMETMSVIGFLVLLVLSVVFWSALPERIPTHFGFAGTPDKWGEKGTLAVLPIIAFIMLMFLSVISRYPHTFNYPWKITEENAKVQYKYARSLLVTLKAETIWSFAYIQWVTIAVALGRAAGLGIIYLPIFMIIMFATLGVYFYKASKYK